MSNKKNRINFDDYKIPDFDESNITNLKENLYNYLPEKSDYTTKSYRKSEIKFIFSEIKSITPAFWITYFIVFIALIIIANFNVTNDSILFVIFSLGPISFLIIIFDIFYGKSIMMIEIELTCKFSIQKLVLIRFIGGIVLNIILCILLSVLFKNNSINFLKLILTYLLPLFWISSITLLFIEKLKSSYVVTGISLFWIFINFIIMSSDNIKNYLINIKLIDLSIVSIVGCILFIYEIYKHSRKKLYSNYVIRSEYL